MDRNSVTDIYKDIKTRHNMDFDLKEEQISIITTILNKQDCMGILGTGYGKSLTFVLPPVMLNMLYPEKNHVAVVVSPLRSLMQSQVSALQEKGVPVAAILRLSEMSHETIHGIQNGKYTIVFASPEALNSDFWNEVFRRKAFKDMVALVAIDEAHCVIHWGESFREDYLRITWLRPVMKDSPFLFLTATCTARMKDEILKQFSVQTVSATAAVPNRPNIYLEYKCFPGMRIDEELTFYIEELREKGQDARKCIIYTRVNPAGEIFEEMMDRLREKAYNLEGKRIIDLFVAKSSEIAKQEVLATFPKKDSHIRCLIASAAFGMGVDIPDIELIIHWGSNSSVLDYWQEVGRAGRDGRPCQALLLATPVTVSDKRMTKDCVRDLQKKVKLEKSCFRLAVLEVLYLECMGEEEMDKITKKPECDCSCTPIIKFHGIRLHAQVPSPTMNACMKKTVYRLCHS